MDWQRRKKAPASFDQAARRTYGLLLRSAAGEHDDQLLPEFQAIFSDEFIDAEPRWALLLLGWAWWEELDPDEGTPENQVLATWLQGRAYRLIQEHHATLPRPSTLAPEHASSGFFPSWLRESFESAEARDA